MTDRVINKHTFVEIDQHPPGAEWRIYMNVERAYREVRGEPFDAPWDQAETLDEIYGVAVARDITPVFGGCSLHRRRSAILQ